MGAPPPRHGGREVSRCAAPRGRTAGAGPPSHHGGAPRPAPRGRLQGLGPRVGGRRGTSFTTRPGACEAEGGAPAAGRSGGAHRRDSGAGRAARSSDRHSEGRGGGTRGHTGGAGRQGRGCRRCPPPPQPGRRRSGASNSSSPLRSPVLRGEPRPSGGAGRQERTLPRRGDRSYSSPGRLGSWSAGETP